MLKWASVVLRSKNGQLQQRLKFGRERRGDKAMTFCYGYKILGMGKENNFPKWTLWASKTEDFNVNFKNIN
jgi:hypothetical protein